jgi:hypothetical protein
LINPVALSRTTVTAMLAISIAKEEMLSPQLLQKTSRLV